MKKIGGLWKGKNKSKDGRIYLTGEIEVIAGVKTRLMIIQTKEKKNDRSPDYEVLLLEHSMMVDKPSTGVVDKAPVVSVQDIL